MKELLELVPRGVRVVVVGTLGVALVMLSIARPAAFPAVVTALGDWIALALDWLGITPRA